MALEDIFRALEEQAQQERDDILKAAALQAEAITADAADQAARICSTCVETADEALGKRASREANAARLEGRKRVAAVKQKAIAESFDRAAGVLSEVRASSRYPDVFRALAEEVFEGVEEGVTVLVDPLDEELARATLEQMGVSAELKAEQGTSGGLTVVMGEGRIVKRNTLADRLEKVRTDIESQVAEILFS